MYQPRTVVLLLVFIASLVSPTLARAQGVLELRACNRGSVPVQLVVAHAQGTFVYSWRVLGKTIEPGWCDEFYGQSGEALVAFGAKDSRGRFVSLKPTSLPDLGDRPTTLAEIAQNGGRLRTPVLSRDTRTMCVSSTYTFYSTRDTRIPTPAECPRMTLPDVGSLVPITTSYYFSLNPGHIGVYHFNVRANPDRGEVTLTEADVNDVDRASAIVVALVSGLGVHAALATPSDAFDQITYRDTGGFGVGGRGISLTITGSGNLEAQVLEGSPRVRTLKGQELAELHAAVAAIDWPHVEHDYRTPGAADLVTRNLTVVVRGQTYETHADSLAKIPDALRELFSRLDALYRRSTRSEKR